MEEARARSFVGSSSSSHDASLLDFFENDPHEASGPHDGPKGQGGDLQRSRGGELAHHGGIMVQEMRGARGEDSCQDSEGNLGSRSRWSGADSGLTAVASEYWQTKARYHAEISQEGDISDVAMSILEPGLNLATPVKSGRNLASSSTVVGGEKQADVVSLITPVRLAEQVGADQNRIIDLVSTTKKDKVVFDLVDDEEVLHLPSPVGRSSGEPIILNGPVVGKVSSVNNLKLDGASLTPEDLSESLWSNKITSWNVGEKVAVHTSGDVFVYGTVLSVHGTAPMYVVVDLGKSKLQCPFGIKDPIVGKLVRPVSNDASMIHQARKPTKRKKEECEERGMSSAPPTDVYRRRTILERLNMPRAADVYERRTILERLNMPRAVALLPENVSPNLSTSFLRTKTHLIYVDLDNFPGFFDSLVGPLPRGTFVQGFYGGRTVIGPRLSRLHKNNQFFQKLVAEGGWRLHPKAIRAKDSADFQLTFTLASNDAALSDYMHIPFTIISGDRGFRQLPYSSKRTIQIFDPHKANWKMITACLHRLGS
mmetsp:Transcript_8276/g.13401  ORF Transcript_8276/g.13401 Transcript_8276/m.13401 type:complete len:539 (-) Transcript_8276:53-1669(-)